MDGKTTGAILVVIGVVALFAAIVGGGIKIKEIEVGSVPSLWRQGLLGLFGIVVALTGAVFMSGNPPTSNNTDMDVSTQNTEALDQGTGANSTDSSGSEANGSDSNAGSDAANAGTETNTTEATGTTP